MAAPEIVQGFDPTKIVGRTVVTSTTWGLDGQPTLFLVVVTPDGTTNGPDGNPTPRLRSVDEPSLITWRQDDPPSLVTEYVTFATAPGLVDGFFVSSGQALSVGVPPTITSPIFISQPAPNSPVATSTSSTSAESSSASPTEAAQSSAPAAETILATAEYVYLATVAPVFVTTGNQTRSVSDTTRSVGSAIVTEANGTPILATLSSITNFDAANSPTVASTLVSVGTPFPSGLIKASEPALSAGAGVGIGIGVAAAIAIIAFVMFFLFFRRRSAAKRNDASHVSGDYGDFNMTETKTPAVATVQVPQNSSAAVVYNHLPQPKEDNVITGDYSKLKSRIDNHVQNYYLPSGGNEKQALEGYTHVFAGKSPVPLQRLSGLLADPRTRSNVLRAAIAWIITERIHPSGNPNESFLPAEVASAYASLSNNKRMDEQTRSAFLSEWRVMTATLLQPTTGQDTSLPDSGPSPSIQSALREVDVILSPLAVNSDHATRLRHLEEIMKRAARLGWTLFSQPSEYSSDWTDDGRGIVVFPGLLQMTDGNGKPLRRPRPFSQKDVMAL